MHTDSTHTWSLFSSPVVWLPSLYPSCLYYDIMVCVSQTAQVELVNADVDTVAVWICTPLCTLGYSAPAITAHSTVLNFDLYRW